MAETIPFNKISVVGNEEKYLLEVLHSGNWCGRGPKTLALEKLARDICQVKHAFFLTSATAALESGCLLSKMGPGDEAIVPSFGFTSTVNPVVLRGATPVFADIDPSTWNITVETIAPLLTKKTKAIVPVHYGGSSEGIDELRKLCREKNIFLVEDAAQSMGAKRNGKPIGFTPWVTCFSLHETKNISSGEGGFIMTDSDELAEKIEIQIEKGTNRQKFFRGQVDKYTWVGLGSSFVASDFLAAIALGQMEKLNEVTKKRLHIYNTVRRGLEKFSDKIKWQHFSKGIEHNGHVCGFVMEPLRRAQVLRDLKAGGINAVFHYVPLHDAPFAKERGFAPTKDLPVTRQVSEGMVRLPTYYSMTDAEIDRVISSASAVLSKI